MKKIGLFLVLLFLAYYAVYAQSPPDISVQEKSRLRLMGVLHAHSVSSPNFDVSYYRCAWNLDPAVRFISGSVSSYFTITSATASITFDLSNSLSVDSVLYHGAKITFQQSATDALQLTFPTTLVTGQYDSVSIFYKGIPPESGFGSFTLNVQNNTPVLWTLSEPYGAKDWWPCKDVLTDKADSIDIIVTYPSAYQSSSNGLLISEQITGDKKQDHWKHRYPIASYLVAIAITNYTIDRDSVQLPSGMMPVELYAYPEDAALFKEATTTAKAALQIYSKLLGEYPFRRERYAQTQFGWGGGMEHQTNTFITAPNSSLVAHELAHQWFGDGVTTGSWHDLWLNEGFATYMAFVYAQTLSQASATSILQGWNYNIISDAGGAVFVTDTANVNRLFNSRLTYNKGAYVLHMLRWKLGDSTFFRGLRQYLNDPALRYKNARTADLQRNLESASGQSLTEFFNDWIYGEGFPTYKGEWNTTQQNTVQLKLAQTTSHPSVPFFEMPVPVELKNATLDTILTVNHTHNDELFTLDPGFVPDTVIIDPQRWILSKDNLAVKGLVITAVPDAPETMGISVFPNPATNKITILLPAAAVQKNVIRLLTVLGQPVFSKTIAGSGGNVLNIPTQAFAPGIYWMEIVRDTKRVVMKILIIK